MAGMTFSPLTMQAILASLPDVRKKQRRAESLRQTQKDFKEMAKKPGQGNYQPAQQGGLYPTVQQYQPDYAAAGNQMTGALGDYMMGKQADTAQGEYDQAQTDALMQASQQMGGGGEAPTEDTLRMYMGLIGGPDAKDFINSQKARANQIDEDGYIWTQMSNGEWKNSGIKARSGVRTIVDPVSGELIQVSTTTQGGVDRLTEGDVNGQQSGPSANGAPLRVGTAAQAAGNKKTAEIQAEAASAPLIAAREEAEKTGSLTGEARVTARQALPKAQQSLAVVKSHVEKLKNNPVIAKITGDTLTGRVSAIPVIGGGINDVLLGTARTEGKAGADANALINQLTDEAFLDAYSDSMRGTGPISNVEGLRAAQSKLRAARYQSPAQFKDALEEFVTAFEGTVNRMEQSLNAPSPTLSAPAPGQSSVRQPIPDGWEVTVEP